MAAWTGRASITWRSSRTSATSAPLAASSLIRVVTTDSIGGGWGECSKARACPPTSGRVARGAVMT